VRSIFLALSLLLSLSLADSVLAQSSDQTTPPPDEQTPTGPVLQPSDYTPVICDPNAAGFRYIEVRGTGFDAWSTQHLVGALFDARGATRESWSSVWVSPQGRLTLEVNLCADPLRNHGALDAGDYTVAVGQSNGGTIASAGISLAPPPEPGAETDQAAPMPGLSSLPAQSPTLLTPTPILPYVIPSLDAQPAPTPLPVANAAASTVATATPVPGPRTGQGSLQQPVPLGAPGNLVDGWQLVVQGISPDAYQGIKAEVPQAVAPAADQRDFIVRTQATYIGPGTGVFGSARLALYSSATQQTYDQTKNSCGAIPDALAPTVVTQGSVVRGNVCFVVRASDVGSLMAFDDQSNPNDRVYFALQ
jgi:hypothetical protein